MNVTEEKLMDFLRDVSEIDNLIIKQKLENYKPTLSFTLDKETYNHLYYTLTKVYNKSNLEIPKDKFSINVGSTIVIFNLDNL